MELLAGGLMAGTGLVQYNRENFMFDQEQRQKREFQEQKMRVEQFALYREDVRDLCELTVGKMDLYLIAAALLVDKTLMMVCKQGEALPAGSPEWIAALNAISLSSAVMYLLLTLWLAMYASISAQSFGARLLTQFVRLPIAKEEQLQRATASASQFEEQGVGQLLRVPVLQSQNPAGHAEVEMQDSGGPLTGGDSDFAAASSLLPTAMLEHIRLYRRVQLNWQAYDAYARVSLFCGAFNFLYSCMYWCLGQFLQKSAHSQLPALGVAGIFAAAQLTLARLDLRLRARQVKQVAAMLTATILVTVIGMLLATNIRDACMNRKQCASANDPKRIAMEVCALAGHIMHTCVVLLTLRVAKPDQVTNKEDSLLPGKFRSSLYLDVFGWLMNPGGPGTAITAAQEGDDDPINEAEEPAGVQRSTSMQSLDTIVSYASSTWSSSIASFQSESRQERARRQTLLAPEVAAEANRLFDIDSRMVRTDSAQVAGMGEEALSFEQASAANAPAADSSSRFQQEMAARRVHRRGRLPGETPWRAFLYATLTILAMWALSAVWLLLKLVHPARGDCQAGLFSFWCDRWMLHPPDSNKTLERPRLALAEASSLAMRVACAAGSSPVTLRASRTGNVQARLPSGKAGAWLQVSDAGCDFRRPSIDAALSCPSLNDSVRPCMAALLRRGGRTVSLCHLHRGATLSLTLLANLRLVAGASGLRSLALTATFSHAEPMPALRFLGRAVDGSLMALRAEVQRAGSLSSVHLLPVFALERPAAPPKEEQLFAREQILLSVVRSRMGWSGRYSCPTERHFDPILRLRAWDMQSGQDASIQTLASSLAELCSQRCSSTFRL